MNRIAVDVGAFPWNRIQRLYDADPALHWQRCEAEGLVCPQEVFTQLFHEEANHPDLAALVRAVDWGRVRWELQEFLGSALRRARIDRAFQLAVDEARARVAESGLEDDRPEVLDHWRDAQSWLVPPVLVSGEVLGSSVGYELLVGFTRLGNLLGLLDREQVPAGARHLVWVGSLLRPP